jgi:hypothetical protein
LRLTQPGGPLSTWAIPDWLSDHGLTYHRKPWRWPIPGILISAARGQEFICDVGDDPRALVWLKGMMTEIDGATEVESIPDDIFIVVLRQPRKNDANEQRNDPFWEFGSFGVTGCHSRNLLNPRKAHELEGKRMAFAQGGPNGFKLIHLTPPVTVKYHAAWCELFWPATEMPLTYASAPTLIDNSGHTDFPALLDVIEGVARRTHVSQFASKFRSCRQPLHRKLGQQIAAGFKHALKNGGKASEQYTDCLPYLPPKVDLDRRKTYRELLRQARGEAMPNPKKKKRC